MDASAPSCLIARSKKSERGCTRRVFGRNTRPGARPRRCAFPTWTCSSGICYVTVRRACRITACCSVNSARGCKLNSRRGYTVIRPILKELTHDKLRAIQKRNIYIYLRACTDVHIHTISILNDKHDFERS